MSLRVLATRPLHQNNSWVNALQAANYEVIELPLLEIVDLGKEYNEKIKATILRLDEYERAIFISQNAVSRAFNWIDKYWPQLPLGITWLAIGKKTQNLMLKAFGGQISKAETCEAMNSDALLSLASLNAVEQMKILIFRGLGGREYLAETLRSRGATVEYCELYERRIPEMLSEKIASIEWLGNEVLPVFSGDSLTSFVSQLQDNQLEHLKNLQVITPGERVKHLALELGFKNVITATNATEESMLSALRLKSQMINERSNGN